MDYQELIQTCDIKRASEDRLKSCLPFVCSDADINEFFSTDVHGYQRRLLTKAYIVTTKDNPNDIIVAYTISNDSIRLTSKLSDEYRNSFLDETDLRDKNIKRFPGVLIGRFGTARKFEHQGYGSAVMDVIKFMAKSMLQTGCRFLIVDAINKEDTLTFYQKNGFHYLIKDEQLEAKYVGVGVGTLPL
ncbi:MAG: GNAT family N-acetyltransferase, partial [Paludibacteraceae bacterium]|nr:GNAT family N-acetyltransferase [Paludibacteraceae bacterium]